MNTKNLSEMSKDELVSEIKRMRLLCIEVLEEGPGDRTSRNAMRAALRCDNIDLCDREVQLALDPWRNNKTTEFAINVFA
jgi:hypothetical protein